MPPVRRVLNVATYLSCHPTVVTQLFRWRCSAGNKVIQISERSQLSNTRFTVFNMQPERMKLISMASRWLFPLSSSAVRQSPMLATSCVGLHGGIQAPRFFCSSSTPGSRDPHPQSSSSEPASAAKVEPTSAINAQTGSSPSLVNSTAAGWLRGPHGNGPSAQLEDEWEEMIDPATDKTVYRNLISGESPLSQN